MSVRKQRPRFKRGDRVEWSDTASARSRGALAPATGTVREIHKLGGYGFHYEIELAPGCATSGTVEVEEWALRPISLLDRIAEAAAEPMRTGLPKPKRRRK